MKQPRRLGRLIALAFILPLSACVVAQPADPQKMLVISVERHAPADPALAHGICIDDVQGGRATNPLLSSQVDSLNFRRALDLSLDDAGLLSRQDNTCRYRLTANLVELKQPWIGMNMTVAATVDYNLYVPATKQTYLRETIVRDYTATVGDAFVGVKRLQIANEGAIRENIHAFIEDLLAHPVAAAGS